MTTSSSHIPRIPTTKSELEDMFSRKGKRSNTEVPVSTEAAELAPVKASEGKSDVDALVDLAQKGQVF